MESRALRGLGQDIQAARLGPEEIAIVLVAVFAVIVTGVHFGLAAMIASAITDIWVVAPIVLAALVLFVWGIFQTQAEMYATLSTTSAATIAELETALARSKEPPPDYEAWRHVDLLTIKQAAFLWCDLPPRMSMPTKVQAWSNALASAVRKGELGFEFQRQSYVDDATARVLQRKNPTVDTVVKRTELQRWANDHDHHPIFLRDA